MYVTDVYTLTQKRAKRCRTKSNRNQIISDRERLLQRVTLNNAFWHSGPAAGLSNAFEHTTTKMTSVLKHIRLLGAHSVLPH